MMKKLILFLFFFLLPSFLYPSSIDLKLGYEAFVKKDYPNAVTFLKQASVSKNSPLRDYYLWSLGSSLFEIGKLDEAIALLEELQKNEPQSIFASASYGPLALAIQQKGENEKIKKWVPENLSKMNEAGKGEATYALALAEQSLGEKESALKHFKEVFVQYPFVDEAKLAEMQLQNSGQILNADDYVTRGDRFYQNKNYASALSAYEMASSKAAQPVYIFSKGRTLYFLKRYSEAVNLLASVSSVLPPELQKEALYYQGLSASKSNQDILKRSAFMELQQKFPGSPEAAEGLQLVVKMELAAGRISEAQNVAKMMSQNYPGGNYRDRALWPVAWNAYENKDWANAKFFFEELSKGKTDLPTQVRGLYWLARIYQNEGNSQKAQGYFNQAAERAPLSYYSFMALKQLKNSKDISEVPAVPASWKNFSMPSLKSAISPSPHPSPSREEGEWNYHWLKAEALYRAGLGKYSQTELIAALDQNANHPGNLFKILEASKKTDAYFLPVLLAQRYWDKVKDIFTDSASAENYRNSFQFPYAFRSQVQHAARATLLSPYFIVGLMRQESAFQPWVISSANAQGLMQMLPATARGRAKAAGIAMGDLFDPEKNIELGSAELSALLNRFSGNWVDAICGYNAGPGRPPQWRAQFGSLPTDEYIEEIPFAETTLYVRLVLRNYWSYATLYR